MAAPPSDSEMLEYHYNYEIDMLANTLRLISEYQVKLNAFMETFGLHARNLIEFFNKESERHRYTETCYTAFAGKKRRVKYLNRLINNQISHLDVENRTADDTKKISDRERLELMTILAEEIAVFRGHLNEQCRGMAIRALMRS